MFESFGLQFLKLLKSPIKQVLHCTSKCKTKLASETMKKVGTVKSILFCAFKFMCILF